MSVPNPAISGTSDSPDIEDGSEHERYPGPRSFSDSEVDQRLFFGREVETEELFHRVRANRLLVLFGKSGLGKTSLLQAGLYPKLRAHNLLPVPVRLNEPGVEPVTRVIDSVLDVCKVRGIDCEPGSRDGLWAFFKSMDMWHGDLLITPVLVFDQFEEIFTLQDAPFRRTLASELKDLSGRGLPPSVRDRRAAGERLTFSDTPPALHIILSLREEYVGSLEELVADVPAIFEHRFQLKAMGEDNARRAIVEPATIDESGIFTVPPFRFAVPALEAMLDFLKSRTGEIEPFQLQVLCQHVEREVATQQAKGVRDVSVDEHLLGGKAGLGKVLRNFYTYALRRLRKVHGHRQCRRAKQLCERALLNPDGRRVSVDEGSIHRQFKIKDDCFDTLIKTRLIRKETRPGLEGYYYELSHDSLALPIQEGRRRSRIQKTVMLLALFVFLFGYGIYVSLDYRALEEKTAQQLDNVALAAQLVEDARQLSEIGNINSALVKLTEAISLAPERAEPYRLRASLFSRKDLNALATTDYDKAITIAPLDPENYIQRGVNRLQRGNTTGAIEDFNESISLDPDNATGYYYLGAAASEQKSWKAAIDAYSKALELKRDYGEAYFERAQVYVNLKDTRRAVADFERVLTTGVDPEIEAAAKARLKQLGRKPEAPRMSVAVYYQDARDEKLARSIALRLVRNSGSPPVVEKRPRKTSGSGSVVYYFESDRAQAQNVQARAVKLLASKGMPVKLALRYQSREKSSVPATPGTIEVWLPPLSQASLYLKSR